jgi:hypothetical protein
MPLSYLNGLSSAMGQQQAYHNSLAQYQAASLSGLMGLYAGYPEPTAEEMERRWLAQKEWALERARAWASDGEKITVRLAFWKQFGLFSLPICRALSKRLERLTDQIERCVEQ